MTQSANSKPANPNQADTSPPNKQFCVGMAEAEYRNATIEAESEDQARRIAEESIAGLRDDIYWKTVDFDDGQITLVEEC